MKPTEKNKDGTSIPDRPLAPRGDSDARPEEEEKIRQLMDEHPFLRELWKDLPMRFAKPHGMTDKELAMEAISRNPKYFSNP